MADAENCHLFLQNEEYLCFLLFYEVMQRFRQVLNIMDAGKKCFGINLIQDIGIIKDILQRLELEAEKQNNLSMIKKFAINEGQKPTEEQLREVMEAKKYPIEFDEDCPELSPAMYKAFRSVVIQRNRKETLFDLSGERPRVNQLRRKFADDVEFSAKIDC